MALELTTDGLARMCRKHMSPAEREEAAQALQKAIIIAIADGANNHDLLMLIREALAAGLDRMARHG